MADTKVSALTAVATAADTDEYATNQGGTSKRTTRAVLFTDPNITGVTTLSATTDPSTPSNGFLKVYAKKIAQRHMLKTIGPAGVDSALQTAFFQNRILMYVPYHL